MGASSLTKEVVMESMLVKWLLRVALGSVLQLAFLLPATVTHTFVVSYGEAEVTTAS